MQVFHRESCSVSGLMNTLIDTTESDPVGRSSPSSSFKDADDVNGKKCNEQNNVISILRRIAERLF